jgi:hypothetical protein
MNKYIEFKKEIENNFNNFVQEKVFFAFTEKDFEI